MGSVIEELRVKTRKLSEDFHKNGVETFTYTTSNIFTLQENYPDTIVSITKNGVPLDPSDYSFDSSTNEITVSASLTSGDIIIIRYKYYKYSDDEIDGYIQSALSWISISAYSKSDYELENGDIYPVPDNKTEDLISIVASIIIKPNYSEYRLPNLTVRYPRTMSKEEKIQKLIGKFNRSLGITDIIEIE